MTTPAPPQTIGRYRILSQLGAGGMGVVYLAEDPTLQRKVALKVIAAAEQTGEMRLRFLREARTTAQIDHPNVCTIFEAGEDDGRLFIAMQLIEGETIASQLQRRRHSTDEILSIARQVVLGLEEAHRRGVVHRDIKPQNLMIGPSGLKILDFGLARSTLVDSVEEPITKTGMVSGTACYMSPEQLRAESVTAASDVFSLGIVLYELLAGVRPFDRASVIETAAAILSAEPPSLAGGGQRHAALEALARKMLAKSPRSRPDLASIRTELERIALLPSSTDVPTMQLRASTIAPPSARSSASAVAPSVDPEARRAYLRGRNLLEKRDVGSARGALEAFEAAIDLEPEFAAAYSGLADAYLFLGFLQILPPEATIPRARAAALKARELDPSLASAVATLGHIARLYEWDIDRALLLFDEALAIDPQLAIAHSWRGLALLCRQQFDVALASLRKAHELEPLAPIYPTTIGLAEVLAGDVDSGLRRLREVAALASRFAPVRFYLGFLLERLGRLDEAIALHREGDSLTPEVMEQRPALVHALARAGRVDEAGALRDEIRILRERRFVPAWFDAVMAIGFGEVDETLEHLERAATERNVRMTELRLDHRFAVLADHPRFMALLRAIESP